jgi:aspartate aminotransferase-like enzyme
MTNLSTGEYYSRFWKQRQLTADSWFQDDRAIYIPAGAFSNVLYEMIKIAASDHYVFRTELTKTPIPSRAVISHLKGRAY